jgi:hypothetical protein
MLTAPKQFMGVTHPTSCVDENGADTPKTIHCGGAPISGGAPKKRGRGAPPGNLNALKTGRYTAKARFYRKRTWEFTSGVLAFVRQIEALYGVRARRFKGRKQLWPVLPDEARRKLREKTRS